MNKGNSALVPQGGSMLANFIVFNESYVKVKCIPGKKEAV